MASAQTSSFLTLQNRSLGQAVECETARQLDGAFKRLDRLFIPFGVYVFSRVFSPTQFAKVSRCCRGTARDTGFCVVETTMFRANQGNMLTPDNRCN